jgi:hypothetical protein
MYPGKKLARFVLLEKNDCKQNTSAYTPDRYCHVGSDGAPLMIFKVISYNYNHVYSTGHRYGISGFMAIMIPHSGKPY